MNISVFAVFSSVEYLTKADWRAVYSPNKQTDEFDLFAVKSKKQTKQIRLFVFWDNLWRANLLSKLTDLY